LPFELRRTKTSAITFLLDTGAERQRGETGTTFKLATLPSASRMRSVFEVPCFARRPEDSVMTACEGRLLISPAITQQEVVAKDYARSPTPDRVWARDETFAVQLQSVGQPRRQHRLGEIGLPDTQRPFVCGRQRRFVTSCLDVPRLSGRLPPLWERVEQSGVASAVLLRAPPRLGSTRDMGVSRAPSATRQEPHGRELRTRLRRERPEP
jgi:hypothetical protein